MKDLLCLKGLEGRLLLSDRRGGRVHRRRGRAHLSAGNPGAHFDFIRRGALAAVDSERKCSLVMACNCEGDGREATCADL